MLVDIYNYPSVTTIWSYTAEFWNTCTFCLHAVNVNLGKVRLMFADTKDRIATLYRLSAPKIHLLVQMQS